MALRSVLGCIVRPGTCWLNFTRSPVFYRVLSSYQIDSSLLLPISSNYQFFPQRSFIVPSRRITSVPNKDKGPITVEESVEKEPQSKPTLLQRFKGAYKIYGKVVLVVHGVTSVLWLGFFYLIAYSGVSIVDALQAVNAPDWFLNPLLAHGLGVWATVVVLYKVASPLRYLVTLAATRGVVGVMRTRGKIPPMAEEDKLRNLARQGVALSRVRLLRTRDSIGHSIRRSKQQMRRPRTKSVSNK